MENGKLNRPKTIVPRIYLQIGWDKKQQTVTLSWTIAEYAAAPRAAKEALRKIEFEHVGTKHMLADYSLALGRFNYQRIAEIIN